MKRTLKLINDWLNWGVESQLDYSLRRKTLHTNMIVLACLLGMLLCDISFLWLGYSQDIPQMLAIPVAQLPIYLLFFTSAWLNRLGRYSAARALLMLTALSSVLIPIVIVIGNHLRFHYFLLLIAAAPMVMYSLREWKLSLFLSLTCVGLFFMVQFGGIEHDPILDRIDEDTVEFLRASYLNVMCVILLVFAWVIERTASQNERALQLLSVTDPLTGLPNRRFFDLSLRQEIAKGRRHEHSLILAILDVDHFKHVNDTFGHEVGDEVLKCVAQKIAESTRAGSVLARIGGEEFSILFARVSIAEAREVAERIRGAIESIEFCLGGKNFKVTISIGLAEVGMDIEQAFKAADEALYLAKRAGRNRVEVQHV